ncbi:MlaD family protein [Patulibacter defluvii]|uniref:MlaD family protein n=1 Tax=Patulibacter defluvii TaxID=3095358 RepID=UPI002A751702|nr:MlaD family protein [Patulibacter sp. DM4]
MSERPPLRGRSALVANPVLVGAAGILITLVAFVLAYNANSGLPFVRTYDVAVDVPDAAGLVAGNDVRKGGARIGQLGSITPIVGPDGRTGARLHLKLDRSSGKLPVDSRIAIRPKSPLGLRYVDVTAGRSSRMVPQNGRIALDRAAPAPVDFDDFFNTFDPPTRRASQENLVEFGAGLAGRGAALNRAIVGLLPLVTHLEPAARNLVRPETGFAVLFPALARAAAEVAPVAREQARLFTALRQTFAALSSVRTDLMASISYGPRALKAGTEELPKQAAFMRSSTALLRRLRPAFASLSAAAPDAAAAFAAGTPALRRAPALNRRLIGTLGDLERFNDDQRVHTGLQALTNTAVTVRPLSSFLAPAQTVCNYGGVLLRNLANVISEGDAVGAMLRVSAVAPSQVPASEVGPSAVPSSAADPDRRGAAKDSYLHSNPYPNTAAPGQPRECEAGSESKVYRTGAPLIGNVPGLQGVATTTTGRWKAASAKGGR